MATKLPRIMVNAARNAKGDVVVPWVNASEAGAGYHVTNGLEPGWRTVREIPFTQWIGRSGSIYILSR